MRHLEVPVRALLAVAAGGVVGSAARTGVEAWVGGGEFPVAVLVVNLVGSFLLGFYLSRRERTVSGETSLHFWAIGALGSFTTFSTFSVELVVMLEAGDATTAASYLAASILGGLIAAVMGLRIGAGVR